MGWIADEQNKNVLITECGASVPISTLSGNDDQNQGNGKTESQMIKGVDNDILMWFILGLAVIIGCCCCIICIYLFCRNRKMGKQEFAETIDDDEDDWDSTIYGNKTNKY